VAFKLRNTKTMYPRALHGNRYDSRYECSVFGIKRVACTNQLFYINMSIS